MKPTQYRACVGVMLVNRSGHAFVGQRIDNREGDFWQMPQGGVDDGEDLQAAALRELEEETGVSTNMVTILQRTAEPIRYDLPEELIGKLWKGKYCGQEQVWFLMRFNGNDDDVNLQAHNPAEFCAFKWVEPGTLEDLIVPFKKRVYRSVVEEFSALV